MNIILYSVSFILHTTLQVIIVKPLLQKMSMYRCGLCNYLTNTKEYLEAHWKTDCRLTNNSDTLKPEKEKNAKKKQTLCPKCSNVILSKNLKRHLKNIHSKIIIINYFVPRQLIDKASNSESVVDADSIKTLTLLRRIIKIKLKKHQTIQIMTHYKNSNILKLELKGVEIKIIQYKSQCNSCCIFSQFNICSYQRQCIGLDFSEELTRIQQEKITEILHKNNLIHTENYFLQNILNLAYEDILLLYFILREIIKVSSIVFYNVHVNSSTKNKKKFKRKRKKYYHNENVYKIKKKIFYKLWNYFNTIKKFNFKHLLGLDTLKKIDGRYSAKYLYIYIRQVDIRFIQIKQCLSIYTIIDPTKNMFPKSFLECMFQEFKNVIYTNKFICGTYGANELCNYKVDQTFTQLCVSPAKFYDSNQMSVTLLMQIRCLELFVERHHTKEIDLFNNCGIWKIWKLNKIKAYFEQKKPCCENISNFVNFSSRYYFSMSFNKKRVKLLKFERLLQKQNKAKLRNQNKSWNFLKNMDTLEYRLYTDNLQRVFKKPKFNLNSIKCDSNKLKTIHNRQYNLDIVKKNQETYKSIFSNNTNVACTVKRPFYRNYSNFILFNRNQISLIQCNHEHNVQKLNRQLEILTKVSNESWLSFVDKLNYLCSSYLKSKSAKKEKTLHYLKRELSRHVEMSDNNIQIETFQKVCDIIRVTQCPLKASSYIDTIHYISLKHNIIDKSAEKESTTRIFTRKTFEEKTNPLYMDIEDEITKINTKQYIKPLSPCTLDELII